VYDALMKDAKEGTAAAPAPGGGEAEDKTVYKVDPGAAPAVGPKTAPVTIVEFSDFQCPFCSRVVPTVKQIEEKYQGKVRVAFRNYPLPFHDKAQLAAEAAMAANAQGKFWEMHDKLFGNQQALDRPALEKYAMEIGLDLAKFKADLDSGKHKAEVTADVTYANSLGGGMGTPTFFINGKKVAGAMPFDAFAAVIDEELKKKK
jgi:protein-disulfide isomerase